MIDFTTFITYSTTEQQIGYTDGGKPLYRIAYTNVSAPAVANVTTTVLTLPNNFDVVRIYGMLYNSAVPITVPLPGVLSNDNYFRLTVNPSTKQVQMGLGSSNYANDPCTIIVEYTKFN